MRWKEEIRARKWERKVQLEKGNVNERYNERREM